MHGNYESGDSKNPGNWITFIKLQLETNPTFKGNVKSLMHILFCAGLQSNGRDMTIGMLLIFRTFRILLN
jgi:hypothetical protein